MRASFSCLCRHLNNNQLTGAIPDSLGSLSSLQQLYVGARAMAVHACDGRSACQLRL